jgi:AmmeMemoRadiSam system protein B
MSLALRPTAVAGTFYPAVPRHLVGEVDELLHDAGEAAHRPEAAPAPRHPPKALIVPHAGYRYSGPIAATAYASLVPFAERIRRVVLVGPSHRAYFTGLALPEASVFETPLGPVTVDEEAVALVPFVPRIAAAHAREHSLEVQLPFLMRVLPDFKIVPLVAGDAGGDEVAAVLDALWGGPETLIVVSSDLSHYLPYDVARRMDRATAQRILDLVPAPIDHVEACGATPVNGLLVSARRRRLKPALLDLRSSGDTAGDRAEVVGYGAFAFFEEALDDH